MSLITKYLVIQRFFINFRQLLQSSTPQNVISHISLYHIGMTIVRGSAQPLYTTVQAPGKVTPVSPPNEYMGDSIL